MVEYVLLVVAVLTVCLFFFTTKSGGPMPQAVNTSLNSILNQINNINAEIKF